MYGRGIRRGPGWLVAVVVALALAPPGDAWAGKKSNDPALPASGRTIAGPGGVSLEAGESRTVWTSSGGIHVCATVAGAGGRGSFLLKSPSGGNLISVNPGQTISWCELGRTALSLHCLDRCDLGWRVDQMR